MYAGQTLNPRSASSTRCGGYRNLNRVAKEKAISIWNPKTMTRALGDAFLVEPCQNDGQSCDVRGRGGQRDHHDPFLPRYCKGRVRHRIRLQITLWLWFTVLFANFAEAMAEGRGKVYADNLRKSRTETTARKAAAQWADPVGATQFAKMMSSSFQQASSFG